MSRRMRCSSIAAIVCIATSIFTGSIRAADSEPAGPILWSQYTVHAGVLKLQVQLDIDADAKSIALETRPAGGDWQTPRSGQADSLSRTVLFRIENWDSSKDHQYRVRHPDAEQPWSGRVRRDPVDKQEIALLAVSCLNDKGFPYREAVERIKRQDPDLMFFAGDQIYEGNGGFGIVRAETAEDVPAAMENYLRKWRYFGMTFRDLMKDRPTIIIPDDHDVYANDLWGDGGRFMRGSRTDGGYPMHPLWVAAVERTQMGQLPDPYDPEPTASGIRPHYTRLDWGGVSFAILEDRKFKSPPGRVLDEPVGTNSLEVVRDADFDPAKLDKPGLHLLGEMQEQFLAEWAAQSRGNVLKAVLSQSPFANVATYHPLDADLDSNGWPQSARTRALRIIDKSGAVMVQGDVHLATLYQHALDQWQDGPWAMSLPGFHPPTRRSWERGLGNVSDRFGNRYTLHAVANGKDGYGLVRFNKGSRTVTFECWPTEGSDQLDGWPVTIAVEN